MKNFNKNKNTTKLPMPGLSLIHISEPTRH